MRLKVFWKGVLSGVLYRNSDKQYVFDFTETGLWTPLAKFRDDLSVPSGILFPVFESILSEGDRRNSLGFLVGSFDPLILLSSVRDHPMISFSKEVRKSTQSRFPNVPFGEVLHGKTCIPYDVLRNRKKRPPSVLSTFSGMQDKFVVVTENDGTIRLPDSDEHGNSILKPIFRGDPRARFDGIVQNEYLFCNMASKVGLDCATTVLCDPSVPEVPLALLSKRFDVDDSESSFFVDGTVVCGLSVGGDSEAKGRYPAKSFFDSAQRYLRARRQMEKLAKNLFFSVCIGNTDMHLRNFSFECRADGRMRVAPLYDVANLTVYGESEFALLFDLGDESMGMRPMSLGHESNVGVLCDFVMRYVSADKLTKLTGSIEKNLGPMLDGSHLDDRMKRLISTDIKQRTEWILKHLSSEIGKEGGRSQLPTTEVAGLQLPDVVPTSSGDRPLIVPSNTSVLEKGVALRAH